jgi:phage/plasmid-like protein (TIGR03299 family)
MSHMIENNMLAYKGERPWHGLGVAVDPKMTGKEMLEVAKLAWLVQRRHIAMKSADNKLLVAPLSNYRAIVRADTDRVFQVATDSYYPVQNAQIVDFFREFCEAGHAVMETVGGLRGGAIVWALAKLNGGTHVKIGGIDELEGYLLLATSHDGSVRTIGKACQNRVVCWNTLMAAFGEERPEFRMKHSRKWNEAAASEARSIMGMAVEQIQQTNEIAEQLSHATVDEKGRLEFVYRLIGGQKLLDQVVEYQSKPILEQVVDEMSFDPEKAMGRVGKAVLEAILDSPGSELATAKDTLWGCVNGVSYYTDHVRGRNQDNRVEASWFGTGADLKQEAMNVAVQMAGIQV